MFLTSNLMGGLGNQMFQIAKAQSEGWKNNLNVLFRPNSYIPMEGNQPIKYKDNIFRKIVFDPTITPQLRISEKSWSYSETNYNYTTPTEFFGYFQSSRNFLLYSEKIKNLFDPSDEFTTKIKNLYPKIFDKDSVSIHVRRGDYLGISDILPVIDKTYIDECIKQIGDYSNIFIFSNDKSWCEENLLYSDSTIVYGLDDYEELWSISLCNHNIMSNSSFSWWGSYLNKNENKKVFVPSIWFGPNGEKNYEDVYENEWIKIKVIYENGKLIYKNINI
jgi:hypothetical protein